MFDDEEQKDGSDADLVPVVQSAELRRLPVHRGRPETQTQSGLSQLDLL